MRLQAPRLRPYRLRRGWVKKALKKRLSIMKKVVIGQADNTAQVMSAKSVLISTWLLTVARTPSEIRAVIKRISNPAKIMAAALVTTSCQRASGKTARFSRVPRSSSPANACVPVIRAKMPMRIGRKLISVLATYPRRWSYRTRPMPGKSAGPGRLEKQSSVHREKGRCRHKPC
jgi:hypothetical protein